MRKLCFTALFCLAAAVAGCGDANTTSDTTSTTQTTPSTPASDPAGEMPPAGDVDAPEGDAAAPAPDESTSVAESAGSSTGEEKTE